MPRLGFIGYGNMGNMLVKGFLKAKIVEPKDVFISSKTQEKTKVTKEECSEINIYENNTEVAKRADYIFISVKPHDMLSVLEEIKPHLDERTRIISLAVCVTLDAMAEVIPNIGVTRVVPSIAAKVKSGISLICHNEFVGKDDEEYVEGLFRLISTIKLIPEEDFEAAIILTSCGPGIMASLLQELVAAGMRVSGIEEKDAEEMVLKTVYGTAKLLFEQNMGLEEIISTVSTKGGITEEGVKVIREEFPTHFDNVFIKTLTKSRFIQDDICNN